MRHQLRSRLAWTGLGSLGGGVWLTPHTQRESELAAAIALEPAAEARSFVAELGSMGDPGALASDAWDLGAVRGQYEAFIEDFARVRALSAEACFRQQTLLVHAWRRFPFLDPGLPARLLPRDWSGAKAAGLFHTRHADWHPAAQRHWEHLTGEHLR